MTDPAPILYLAPSVDTGEPDRGAADWFSHIDRRRWAPSLIVTEPSPSRGLHEIEPLADELWDLPELMPGRRFPEFILGFIESRGVRLVHIAGSRLAFDLLPDMASLRRPPAVVAQLHGTDADRTGYVRYATRRYGNLIDAFSVADERLKDAVAGYEIAPSRIEVIPAGTAGDGHGRLYGRLLAARPASSRSRDEDLFGGEDTPREEAGGEAAGPLTLSRDPLPERAVGVIVPCYRHGIFLDACIDSIKAQTLTPASVVVVDDGSDDPETVEALARLDKDTEVVVVRLPANGGPSIARNRGLAELDTSYVLSIDADDQLLPDALERMLAQLEAAPENVGFVYPHAQHIGNRSDYVQLPAYNLWLLMKENYCPAPALFDRRLFEGTGVAYPEDIVVGHEDWDLILQLAERDVRGVHADGPTFLYRKLGFSRVNAVDYGPHSFHEAIERRHPGLYRNADEIKARWAPALSIVLLGGAGGDPRLAQLPAQTCRDFEVVIGDELEDALDTARGRWVCVLAPAAVEMLRDASFVEKLLYAFLADERDFSIVFGERPDLSLPPFSSLNDDERLSALPVGAAFERSPGTRFPKFTLSRGEPVLAGIAVGLQANGPVQWRLAACAGDRQAEERAPVADRGDQLLDLSHRPKGDKSQSAMRNMIFSQVPRLPELTPGTVRRWKELEGWMPSGTQPLCRHVDFNDLGRVVTNDHEPPPGYRFEFDLGALQICATPGTRRLIYAEHSFELTDDQNELDEGRHGLGYLEQEPMPMLELLELRRMPEGDRHVLVAGEDDPLFDIAEPVQALGWIEALPILPRGKQLDGGPWGVDVLRRGIDHRTLRHVYRSGDASNEHDFVALGSLYRCPDVGLTALFLRADGRLATDSMRPGRASRDPRKIGRWIARSQGSDGRLRSPSAMEARLRHLALHFNSRKLAEGAVTTLGWLRREDAPGCSALFSATHPVTGDQLVTRFPQRAIECGYLVDGVLGYVLIAGAADEPREASQMSPWADTATAMG